MLVDSHCHLDYLERDGDLDEAVHRARDRGIGTMVTICTKVTEFSTVRAIAERYDDVWCTVGIHPHDAANEPAVSTEQLVELAQHPKVIGIGETGLDYYYENSFDDYVYPRHSEALVYRNKTNFRWPNGTIPYKFQSGFNDTYRKRIEIAIQNINANLKCCIIFR